MTTRPHTGRSVCLVLLLSAAPFCQGVAQSAWAPLVPKYMRGRIDAERSGTHDAGNIRTIFYNYGMVGDYPADPINVDLSIFHSAEVPKGSGMNYTDGITPFVLAKIQQRNGADAYIMETGYRERQVESPYSGKIMRFEPRPGYLQADPSINRGRSIAMSHDSRTWPDRWPDKENDPFDPGWPGSWNGYFGKRPNADQESYFQMDDDLYDAWDFYPDVRDATRRGLGLRVEVRGFQWANPQATNVIFWHYDITNDGTTDYNDNIIFGLYMDSGVGGSAYSCDGIAESDDDNAYFDRSIGLNMTYTWDKYGHGTDLRSNCSPTGYLGYAYLETPGNSYDGVDNDDDGITDERRDSGPGTLIIGQDNIRAYAQSHYNMAKFEAFYGKIETRPAFKAGRWWTGDENMNWVADYDDVGADGLPGTHDPGEGDGIPTAGEPDFDQTDKDESDQIGLTGFKMNRIKGPSKADPVDDIVFFGTWPPLLYQKFSDPNPAARFDSAVVLNYNIAFLFASGPFRLPAGKRERFSLALAYGADLDELRAQVKTVQQIYNANYQFAVPPPMPAVAAESGNKFVRLSWSDFSERGIDPVSHKNDFEGYKIYRSTDPDFLDPKVITNARGTGTFGNGKPIAQFDLQNGIKGFSKQVIEGVAYDLGTDSGLMHTWTDSTVNNGQDYFYAVCAYDHGDDSLGFYPSENSISVSRTPRGGTILRPNTVEVRPEPPVLGYVGAQTSDVRHTSGSGTGSVVVSVVDSTVNNGQDYFYAVCAYDHGDDSLGFYPSENSISVSRTPRGGTILRPNTVEVRPEPPVLGYVHAQTSDVRHTSGSGTGSVVVSVVDSKQVPDKKTFLLKFYTNAPQYIHAARYELVDSVTQQALFSFGTEFHGGGRGPVGMGILPSVKTPDTTAVDTSRSGFLAGKKTNAALKISNVDIDSGNVRRPGYPDDFTITFSNRYLDTSMISIYADPTPVKFKIEAQTSGGPSRMKFYWAPSTNNHDSTLSQPDDRIIIVTQIAGRPYPTETWMIQLDTTGQSARGPLIPPGAGDIFQANLAIPFSADDIFSFSTSGLLVDAGLAHQQYGTAPYVVPNPYAGAASFEPERYAVTGRGERRLEFRGLPARAVIRIYTVRGDLVQTLYHDGGTGGAVPWNLRTKDNLDVAPGLYIFHVEAEGFDSHIGKFAIIK